MIYSSYCSEGAIVIERGKPGKELITKAELNLEEIADGIKNENRVDCKKLEDLEGMVNSLRSECHEFSTTHDPFQKGFERGYERGYENRMR